MTNVKLHTILFIFIICLCIIYIYFCGYNKNEYFSIVDALFWKQLGEKVFVNAENKMPNSVASFLRVYGDYKVIGIEVCRKPVSIINKELINALSFGQLKRNLKVRGMDDIFHLWCNITITNGTDTKQISMDKVEIVNIHTSPIPTGNHSKCMRIPGPDMWQVTLRELITNAERIHSPKEFWTYDPATNNCQYFVLSLLNGSGYLTPDAVSFINQRADELLEDRDLAIGVSTKLVHLVANLRSTLGLT